jgi:hypothetical protein
MGYKKLSYSLLYIDKSKRPLNQKILRFQAFKASRRVIQGRGSGCKLLYAAENSARLFTPTLLQKSPKASKGVLRLSLQFYTLKERRLQMGYKE